MNKMKNARQLKQELKEKYDITPKSQTDTEICAIYVGVFLDQGLTIFDAIKKAVERSNSARLPPLAL